MTNRFPLTISLLSLAASIGVFSPPAAAQDGKENDPFPRSIQDEESRSWYLEPINAGEAFRRGYDGKGVLVGVIDTGLDAKHPEFRGRVSPLSTSVYGDDFSDQQGHGTHVAGIIAAARDGEGTRGVAPSADILAIKMGLGDGSPPGDDLPEYHQGEEARAGKVIERAAKYHPGVINGSFGPPLLPQREFSWGQNPNYRQMKRPVIESDVMGIYPALKRASEEDDIVLVFSAGNEFLEQPNQGKHPRGIGFLPLVTPKNHKAGLYDVVDVFKTPDMKDPGKYVYVDPESAAAKHLDASGLRGRLITVVATGRDNKIASYSNRCGAAWQWCLAAPGGDSPEKGESVFQSAILSTVPGSYGIKAGTSMAAPVVAGGAAVLRQAFPYLTALQINELILTTARPIGPRKTYGRGMFDLGRAVQGPKTFGDPLFAKMFDVDTQGYDSVWEGDIGGKGGLIKRGKGNLVLLGSNTYRGGTKVKAGTLTVNGALGSKVEVGRRAKLRGTGSINSALEVAGTLAPGDRETFAKGEFYVFGEATLKDESTLRVEIDGTDSSLLAIMPSAESSQSGVHLDGGRLHAEVADGLAPVEKPVSVIFGKHSGAFGSTTTNSFSAFLDPELDYGEQFVSVSFERNDKSFESVATTQNQRAVARALDNADAGKAREHVAQQSVKTARSAFSQFAGDIHASSKTAFLRDSSRIADLASDRLRAAAGETVDSPPVMAYGPDGVEFTAPDALHALIWGTGYGNWSRLDSDGNAAGLKGHSDGFLGGVDISVADDWRVGVLGGYSTGKYSQDHASAEANGIHLGVYGGGKWNDFRLRGGATYSWLDFQTTRTVKIPGLNEHLKAEYDGNLVHAFAETGWRKDLGRFAVEPFVGIDYARLSTDAFSEHAGIVGLSAGSESFDTTSTTLGVHTSTDAHLGKYTAKLHATLGWRHAYGDTSPEMAMHLEDTGRFVTTGLAIERDEAIVGLGVEFDVSDQGTLSVTYDGRFGADSQSNSFGANLKVKF